jgi:hypothetical protein
MGEGENMLSKENYFLEGYEQGVLQECERLLLLTN